MNRISGEAAYGQKDYAAAIQSLERYHEAEEVPARLEALGYTAHFEMKLTQPQENFDFEKDFLQNQTGGAPTSQYIFDIKA